MAKIPNTTLLAGLGTTLLVSVLGFYFVNSFSHTLSLNTETQNEPQIAAQGAIAGVPMLLSIPNINIEATIEPAGLAADGTIAVPPGPKGVTWYKAGPRPGQMGSAVVTGHYGTWRDGSGSVFDNLNQLKTGDEVRVKDKEGNWFTFVVRESKTYALNEKVPEVFTKTDKPYLNVITCSGDWLQNQKTFTSRLVVFTELKE